MHLKSLEISGFKSFPLRTKLEFCKGMTAIVGPNGCGKSNISDAIRWVLGEQSAKLLRGAKMEDCIFSGTDARKPLGMAEVSLTFSDCDKRIDTEFNEITVTRRVFRSGEGQYFINKTPCRLKDIQRLFMDTGIGTNSYSLMEQGRVDLILSSRPEDRRAVFEEASGITKYKSDKKEALRKLEQTEANLVRLADIIREVKRQIISLQRQAGKARRAQSLRQELRRLDIFVSRERIADMDADLKSLETQIASSRETIEALQQEIQNLENKSEDLNDTLSEIENDISGASREDGELKARLEGAEQSIASGNTRLIELNELLQRDSNEADKAGRELQKQNELFGETRGMLEKAAHDLERSEKLLSDKSGILAERERVHDKMRESIESLYTVSMDLENRMLKLQNQRHDIEVRDRSTAGRRERTAAEQSNLTRVLEGYEKRLAEFSTILEQLKLDAARAGSTLADTLAEAEALKKEADALKEKRGDCMLRISALRAQAEVIKKSISEKKPIPSNTKQWLAGSGSSEMLENRILGMLFEQIETSPEYRIPLEAVLRPILDAVIVTSINDGMELLRCLESGASGPARILAVDAPEPASGANEANGSGVPLIDEVSCSEQILPLARRLLSGTRVVDKLEDVPNPVPPETTYVTLQGAVVAGKGILEIYRRDMEPGNPLAQKHAIMDMAEKTAGLEAQLERHDASLKELADKIHKCEESAEKQRTFCVEKQNALSRKEGEYLGISGQADRIRENLETVTFELRELEKQESSVEALSAIMEETEQVRAESGRIKEDIAEQKLEIREIEQECKILAAEETDARLNAAQHRQTLNHLESRHAPIVERIAELEQLIGDRSERIVSYRADIEKQSAFISNAQERIPALKEAIEENQIRLSQAIERRASAREESQAALDKLKARRVSLDELREKQNELNAGLIECRMKRSAAIERITSEYRIPPDAIMMEEAPEWPEGRPDTETLENTIAELRAKIEAMGPIYEGAIDEYRQLEERFAFLQNQQNDLVNSKQQLMDMIRKINRTTTEMFAQTFAAINNNFQEIFKKLFGGGSAKLMLADEEDLLESGIEIIARPPGKRLQSVSLLSGGERALTAVSLLFAIYLFKPSPFCVLDELDAPLDEANIGRFIKVLESFLEQSQFVIITHNRQTIGAADVLYGITMEEFGVSKVVSMKFSERNGMDAEPAPEKASAEAPTS